MKSEMFLIILLLLSLIATCPVSINSAKEVQGPGGRKGKNGILDKKGTAVPPADLECEFPPKYEEDLTHVRRKRLTTETGLVCLEDYPYTISIRLHGKHWCGGALVGKQWALSAGQCFDYVTADEVTVRLGSVFRDYGGQIMSVIDIRRHPSYRMEQYYPEHNLAMVKLNLAVILTPRIQTVALPVADHEVPQRVGETIVTGFGSVTSGQIREGENQELRRMIVREVNRGRCRLTYGGDYHLQHDHMCLQSVVNGVALCAGDTGDPAVHFNGLERGGTLYGIALFSGTEECTFKAKPGIFAKLGVDVEQSVYHELCVSFSRVWIDRTLQEVDQAESADSGENAIAVDMDS